MSHFVEEDTGHFFCKFANESLSSVRWSILKENALAKDFPSDLVSVFLECSVFTKCTDRFVESLFPLSADSVCPLSVDVSTYFCSTTSSGY